MRRPGDRWRKRMLGLGYDPEGLISLMVGEFLSGSEIATNLAKRYKMSWTLASQVLQERTTPDEYRSRVSANRSAGGRRNRGRVRDEEQREAISEGIRAAQLERTSSAIIDGPKLRAAREAAGLSQAKAAEVIGLGNPDLIREYEKGTRVPAGGVLIRLLLLYRVQPSQVVRYEAAG